MLLFLQHFIGRFDLHTKDVWVMHKFPKPVSPEMMRAVDFWFTQGDYDEYSPMRRHHSPQVQNVTVHLLWKRSPSHRYNDRVSWPNVHWVHCSNSCAQSCSLKTEYDRNLKALSAQQRSIGLFCSSVLKVIRSTKWHGGRFSRSLTLFTLGIMKWPGQTAAGLELFPWLFPFLNKTKKNKQFWLSFRFEVEMTLFRRFAFIRFLWIREKYKEKTKKNVAYMFNKIYARLQEMNCCIETWNLICVQYWYSKHYTPVGKQQQCVWMYEHSTLFDQGPKLETIQCLLPVSADAGKSRKPKEPLPMKLTAIAQRTNRKYKRVQSYQRELPGTNDLPFAFVGLQLHFHLTGQRRLFKQLRKTPC